MEDSEPNLSVPSAVHSRESSRVRSPRREETEDSNAAGRVWAREVDDPWWPCILTLDGGGIRGYSSLLILKALMHEIWVWEQFYDAQYPELTQLVESPTATSIHQELGQATAGASRGRSGSHHDIGNNPEEGEGKHGVEINVTLPDATPPAALDEAIKDNLIADISAKKALSEEELLPCHYFDFMYGTSTGGLIATILGRLRMSVTEGLELYRKVGEDLFGKRKSRLPGMTKYYHEPLEKAVRDIVGSRCREHPNCDGNDLHPWDTNAVSHIDLLPVPFDVDQPRVCQSCCLTATHDESISEAYLLRSYPHYYSENAPNWITRYNEGADPLPIWTVTRATTAAPFYFEMVTAEVENVKKSFKDGGIRENNPSGAALSEFHSLYQDIAPNPALLLSVGTGRPDTTHDGFAAELPGPFSRLPGLSKFLEKRAVIQNLLIKYTEGEKQHKYMRDHAQGEHTWYKRLNVSHGLEGLALDAWQRGPWTDPTTGVEHVVSGGTTLTNMEAATNEYLSRDFDESIDSYAPPNVMLRQAAQKLVIQRRAREAQGGIRWDAFMGKHLRRSPTPNSLTENSVAT